eukprot:CAMPEP_0185029116 /NCGR_PEP_ID=MMETSP1103-20130426/15230_1 /TAXON_ID=36769 /ORGANISM="Paraphysomonas bandaiensis, Strain Caron Lab Isolate" /LENGTH=314 /DNA_ID=CAMNT_0027563737 /DNA_START=274 /DNA_END=1218 /DNA_ORIENTATION=-
MVYNFCCEPGRGYDPAVFHGNVRRFPFKDHNTPPLKTLVGFANDAKAWLERDENNVCSLHCKAGKGRAGLMCCVLLVRTGVCQSAIEAMDYYDKMRTHNNRGLTVTSQRKYVIFYELLWRQYWGVMGDIGQVPAVTDPTDTRFATPEEPTVRIVGVQVLGLWASMITGLNFKIFQGTNFDPELKCGEGKPDGTEKNKWACDCEVTGNFKIFLYQKKALGKKKILEIWHNTLFLDIDPATSSADLDKDQMDIKRKMRVRLGDDLVVRLFFSDNPEEDATFEDVTIGTGKVMNASDDGKGLEMAQYKEVSKSEATL